MLWSSFLQKQALTGNSISKEFFRKIPERPTNVLKKNPTLDVSLESMQSMQKIFGVVIFSKHRWTDACECSNNLFLEHQWTPLDGCIWNRREISICSKVEQNEQKNEQKYSIFKKKILKAKINFLQYRCQCRFQGRYWCWDADAKISKWPRTA